MPIRLDRSMHETHENCLAAKDNNKIFNRRLNDLDNMNLWCYVVCFLVLYTWLYRSFVGIPWTKGS